MKTVRRMVATVALAACVVCLLLYHTKDSPRSSIRNPAPSSVHSLPRLTWPGEGETHIKAEVGVTEIDKDVTTSASDYKAEESTHSDDEAVKSVSSQAAKETLQSTSISKNSTATEPDESYVNTGEDGRVVQDFYAQDYEAYTPNNFVEVFKNNVTTKKPARLDPSLLKKGGKNDIKAQLASGKKFSPAALMARAKTFPPDSAMGRFLAEQQHRRDTVKDLCPKVEAMNQVPREWRGPPPGLLDMHNLIYDRPNMLTFCPVYKAASTSWTTTLLEMSGIKRKKNVPLQKLVGQLYPKISNLAGPSITRSTTRFMVVRHPFERLLSCYRDKFEFASRSYYYLRYGEKMVRRYRKFPKEFSDSQVALLQEQVRNKVKAGLAVVLFDNPFAKPVGPTFPEFVQYVVQATADDEHWRTYHKHCSSCYVEFDFILRFEKLHEEGKHFLEYLNRTGQVQQQYLNPTKSGNTNLDIACSYYSQLSLDQMKGLVKKYQGDFMLYEYAPDAYFNCLKNVTSRALLET